MHPSAHRSTQPMAPTRSNHLFDPLDQATTRPEHQLLLFHGNAFPPQPTGKSQSTASTSRESDPTDHHPEDRTDPREGNRGCEGQAEEDQQQIAAPPASAVHDLLESQHALRSLHQLAKQFRQSGFLGLGCWSRRRFRRGHFEAPSGRSRQAATIEAAMETRMIPITEARDTFVSWVPNHFSSQCSASIFSPITTRTSARPYLR